MTKSHRAELTPQMLRYAEKFDDRGEIRWLPYLTYFHPAEHRSEVVNTDSIGFRISHGGQEYASAGGRVPEGPVRILAGSSTVFGIGATHDGATLSSRLWTQHVPSAPWLNFGGRSHNSTQELLLYTLYRHLVPDVEEIVLFSGFNNLGLARLPQWMRGDHGGFFNCHEYFEQVDELRVRQKMAAGESRRTARRAVQRSDEDPRVPDLSEQIAIATDLTLRHLDTWRVFAEAQGARLTFVLQPLSTWVRDEPAPQEKLLFRELDEIADFGRAYGDIAAMSSGRHYAEELRTGCDKLGVPFVDLSPLLAEAIGPQDWIFVDRIHFTDYGHDVVAGLLADHLSLT